MRWLLILLPFFLWNCSSSTTETAVSTTQNSDSAFVYENYTKQDYRIKMRDGTLLYTVVYSPKDDGTSYPMLLKRTPYNCSPYGKDTLKFPLGPSEAMMRDKYIFVYQDVRGKFMSEGTFLNMTPHQTNKTDSSVVDESSDTYDTIDWLIKNIANNNGKVGMYGVSYPGFYAAAGSIDAHPALVCSSPQAPIADWFWDDFHHHGAFFLPHSFGFLSSFGKERDGLHTDWPSGYTYPTKDGYNFYLNEVGPLSNVGPKFYGNKIAFWDSMTAHPNYDAFWQRRNLLPHLNKMKPAMMTVGGWYDAEDLYGPLHIYEAMEKNDPQSENMIVMGPWRHGGWSRDSGYHHGNVFFGDEQATSYYYQEEVELPWFSHYLKGTPKPDLPEALIYNTGNNAWAKFESWPPKARKPYRFLFGHDYGISKIASLEGAFPEIKPNLIKEPLDPSIWSAPFTGYRTFESDPQTPVPYTEDFSTRMTKAYMTDDQRFATKRPDVLVWQTLELEEDLTLVGEMIAHLKVAITGEDADWIVKIIDVYPDSTKDHRFTEPGQTMGGYQQMVRSEVIRGRFRNSYEHPEPFIPNQMTSVDLPLQDVCHTFKKGHRLMIHVQSTWFPMVDRNPQTWVDNIFEAQPADFKKQTHTVFVGDDASWLECSIIDMPE